MNTEGKSETPLPNFVIAGAMKSGTTSLRIALAYHPQVFCAREQHFFCEHFDRGVDWYREQFRLAGDKPAVGEKCPDYWYRAEAVERMAELLPGARIIVMLRNPVDRAYSHYWHERREGREKLPLVDALNEEPARIQRGEWGVAYIDMGRYVTQLERLASFYPKSSIHVVLFEDFKTDPGETFADVCRFLGVDDAVRPPTLDMRFNEYRNQRFPRLFKTLKRHQAFSRLPRPVSTLLRRALVQQADYPPLEKEMRAKLNDLFASDNAALAVWLGRDLTPWDTPRPSPESARGSL